MMKLTGQQIQQKKISSISSIGRKYFYALAFLLPVMIYLGILLLHHITPFGSTTLLHDDMASQYAQFCAELTEKLHTGDSVMYSFRSGMGNDFLCNGAYYLTSPLNLLLVFFSANSIALAFSLLVGLRMGLAGLTMSIYLKKGKFGVLSFSNSSPSSHHAMILVFSCCYALCSYSVNYYYNLMWMDGFLLLPLLALALEKLYDSPKKCHGCIYSIVLGLAILSNFYIGYMLCIFCVLYYIYLLATDSDKVTGSAFFRRSGRFLLYSILAGALAAVLLVPELCYLSDTVAGDLHFYKKGIFSYYSAATSLFRMMADASPTYMHHPYLHSTVAAFFLLPLYFCNSSIRRRERIASGAFLLFFLLSFQWNILDYIWNGFHMTNCLPGRYAFLFLFLAILLCFRALGCDNSRRRGVKLICYGASLALFFYLYQLYPYTNTFSSIQLNLCLMTVYLLIYLTEGKGHLCRKLFLLGILAEICFVSYHSIVPGYEQDSWREDSGLGTELLDEIHDDSFYRVKNDTKLYSNEGALLGYYSIPSYSSQSSKNVSDALFSMGFHTGLNEYNDISYEPVSASMLGIKYLISKQDFLADDILALISEKRQDASTPENDLQNTYLYENTDALAPAFLIPQDSLTDDMFDDSDPFLWVNAFAQKAAGLPAIYTPVDLSQQIEKGMDVYVYGRDQLLGLVFESLSGHSETLYGTERVRILLSNDSNYIYHIASSTSGGRIAAPEGVDLSDITAYSRNTDAYARLMDVLAANQLVLDSFSSTRFSGTLSASYDGTVFTSIPYSKGWSVTVDGKAATTFSVQNAFLCFSVPEGSHHIVISYTTKGLRIGSLITLAAILLVAAISWYQINRISSDRTCSS